MATVLGSSYLDLNLELTGVKTAELQVLHMLQRSWTTLKSHLTSLSLNILILNMGIIIVPTSQSSEIINSVNEYKACRTVCGI